ncbi:HesB/YadR/YfhF family protein [Paenibacillus sp. 481]|uniref:HesB/YadR/YfhF family protein n=1 Tax=Paenibacillus sp. 481 TaxID=2835869 RepID=UPI001E4575B3|nr:Fe-S cluster assembly protein HesB [Paenibacillus sp. 481]UHA73851.1 Fe-S cluster assembly protein HesB [Paenibacillus sp. 481]
MQLRVTSEAVRIFVADWDFTPGDSVRIFVRYSGFSDAGPYSFGIMKDSPRHPAVTVQAEGITFFMEQNDVWFLEDQELTLDGQHNEIVFVRGA